MTQPPHNGLRVALVTGAARGLGAVVVHRLVDGGFHVVALDSCGAEGAATGEDGHPAYPLATRADLDAVVAAHPGLVEPVVADVRDRGALEAAVGALVERHGRLDVVVAGAAVIAGGQPLWETPQTELDLLWQVDVVGVWHTAAATVPQLLARPASDRPTLVAITSTAGATGLWGLTAYVMAKHAVVGLVRGLAADLEGTSVTVCGVAPPAMRTAMLDATAALYGLDDTAPLAQDLPDGRPLDPGVVADVVLRACTSGTAVHGTVIEAYEPSPA